MALRGVAGRVWSDEGTVLFRFVEDVDCRRDGETVPAGVFVEGRILVRDCVADVVLAERFCGFAASAV